MIEQNLPLLLPVVLLVSSLLVAGFGSWKRALAYPISLASVALAFGLAVVGLQHVLTRGSISYRVGGWAPPIGIEYVLDPLAAFVSSVILGVSLLVFVHAKRSVEIELPGRSVPFYALSMLLLSGLTGIVVTGDLFNLYVFLEITALSSYGLVAVGEKPAPVAAFRYLLLGTIGASLYLLGLGFFYMVGGSLNMVDAATILRNSYAEPTVIVGLTLMVIGIGIKMALFPLHGWLPDAYTYASSTGSALLAPIGTKVAAYVLLRVLFFVFDPHYTRITLPVTEVIGWLAVGGILFGSIMAIAQKELKRMLAYSSVAQIGYIGIGISLANPLGFIGVVLHIVNHAFMKACLFLVAGNLRASVGHSTIPRFDNSLRRAMPWTMAAFAVASLSMIGLPPTAGFFSKWYLVLGAIDRSNWVFVVVILLSSLLNAVYFFRVLEKVYLRAHSDSRRESANPVHHTSESDSHGRIQRNEPPASMVIPTVVLAVGIIVLGVFNAFIVDWVITRAMPAGF